MRQLATFVLGSFVAAGACASDRSPPIGGQMEGGVGPGADAGPGGAGAGTGGGGVAGAPGPDAGAAPDDVSSLLGPVRTDGGLPALAGAVWRGEQLAAIGVSGVRKYGDSTLATIDDLWHLGSDTKAMTATLVGISVDRGRIHFEDTLAALFPGETIDPGYQGVTLIQLLQHRGGAPGEIPTDIWSRMWADGADPDARIRAVRALLGRAPAQAPGTFVYANAGYMIAGAALERALGLPWEQILQAELFTPLHMRSCGFGAPGTAGRVDQPWGHQIRTDGGDPVPVPPGPNADNPPSMGPAGTVHCSLADWGKFLAVHLAGARGQALPSGLVSQATLTRLQTPPPGGDYACGWAVGQRPWAGGRVLSHSGSNTMWLVTAWLAPGRNVTFAAVTNRGDRVAGSALDSAFGPLIQRYTP